MKLHYAGKYNLNPESLPHGEHRPGAVPFKELQNPRDFAVFINAGCLAVTALLMALAFWRSGGFYRAPPQEGRVIRAADFPFLAGMLFPRLLYFLVLGALTIGMGFGDYYNVHNALTQMPKGARTYLYGFHSFWYLPE